MELRRQGLVRVNISLDSLDPGRYARITRGGRLDQALTGLDSALAAGFRPLKLNVLLLEGVEEELDAFVELTRSRPIHVRFIEFMPLDRRLGGKADGRRLVPAPVALERLRARHTLVPDRGPYGNGPARYWRAQGATGSIGFVAGVSDHFCGRCTRLRLTANGRLKTCLFSGDEIDVRPFTSDSDKLRGVIQAAMTDKRFDRCLETLANQRAMSEVGG
jgi:cyclic pyranopterin phosphate synthase